MNNLDKNLSEVFDVTPIGEPEPPKKQPLTTSYKQPEMDSDLTDAYQQSKENLQGIIDQGQEAMYEILEIAKAGQHPRAFEVVSGMIKNVSDVNDRLMDLHKKKKSYDQKDVLQVTAPEGTTNNLFVGSTVDLQRMLQDMNNPVKDDNVIDITDRLDDGKE